jgi:hypothetical protein
MAMRKHSRAKARRSKKRHDDEKVIRGKAIMMRKGSKKCMVNRKRLKVKIWRSERDQK